MLPKLAKFVLAKNKEKILNMDLPLANNASVNWKQKDGIKHGKLKGERKDVIDATNIKSWIKSLLSTFLTKTS